MVSVHKICKNIILQHGTNDKDVQYILETIAGSLCVSDFVQVWWVWWWVSSSGCSSWSIDWGGCPTTSSASDQVVWGLCKSTWNAVLVQSSRPRLSVIMSSNVFSRLSPQLKTEVPLVYVFNWSSQNSSSNQCFSTEVSQNQGVEPNDGWWDCQTSHHLPEATNQNHLRKMVEKIKKMLKNVIILNNFFTCLRACHVSKTPKSGLTNQMTGCHASKTGFFAQNPCYLVVSTWPVNPLMSAWSKVQHKAWVEVSLEVGGWKKLKVLLKFLLKFVLKLGGKF